jgi:hypothetical protein
VLTQQEATQLIRKELARLKRADDYQVTGFLWTLAEKYKNRWDVLPK